MNADERLTALKKAYADIILNTAKEAAARIISSERKALRFQQELNVTKEQSLQMLVRLKQMMDSKISEADAKSLNQQRKIEELEAQLQEAEDIVKDIREELREVHAELERVRNNKLQHAGERDAATQAQTAQGKVHAELAMVRDEKLRHAGECDTAMQEQTGQGNSYPTSQSYIFPPPASKLETSATSDMKYSDFNQRNEVYRGLTANDDPIGTSNIRKPELLSKLEVNRLSTSQSILFPPPESRLNSSTASDMKSTDVNRRNEVYKCHSAIDFPTGNSFVGKSDLPSIILRSKEPELNRNRRTQRIRAFEEKLMAGELAFSETVEDVNYETSGREHEQGDNMCGAEKKSVVQADSSRHKVQKVKSFPQKRRRATRCKKNRSPSSMYLSTQAVGGDQTSDIACTTTNSDKNHAHPGGDHTNVAPILSADTTDRGIILRCTNVAESDANFLKSCSVQIIMNKNQASMNRQLQTRLENGSAESSVVPICRMRVEEVDVPVLNSQAKTPVSPNGISNPPVSDRVIKYTFQRKRKKESLSNSDGNSLENNILKKKTAEKQNDPLEVEKSSSIIYPSRDSRRLAQVARQLISLSEKKW